MSELPDFTVAVRNFDQRFRSVFCKRDGQWINVDSAHLRARSDEEFWAVHPDAVVVALPTARELARDEAEADLAFDWDPEVPIRLLAKSQARRAKYRRVDE